MSEANRIYITETAHGFMDELASYGGDGLWHERVETANVDGVFFRRSSTARGKSPDPPTSHWRRAQSQHANAPETPEVLCGKCFGQAFTLFYGSYEVRARCVACGHEDEVYSG